MNVHQKIFAVLCMCVAVSFTVLMAGVARAADKECVLMSEKDFHDQVKKSVVKMHVVDEKKMRSYLVNRNAVRFKANLHQLEADKMLVGELSNGWIGTIMFKDGCVVPGTEEVGPLDTMRDFFKVFQSEDIMAGIGGGA